MVGLELCPGNGSQEYFKPKRAFKSKDLKALLNSGRADWTNIEPAYKRFIGNSRAYVYIKRLKLGRS